MASLRRLFVADFSSSPIEYEDKWDSLTPKDIIASAKIANDGSDFPFIEIFNCLGNSIETIYFKNIGTKDAGLHAEAINFISSMQNGQLRKLRRKSQAGILAQFFEGDFLWSDESKNTLQIDQIRKAKAEANASERQAEKNTHLKK